MAVDKILFHVLDVGQGSCNYIEVFDGDDMLYNMLIDLGTNSSMAIAADNVEWLYEKIEENNNYLNALIITHGDTDHYNLIADILPAFGPPDNEQIGLVRYGGPAWRYGNGLIDTLEEYAEPEDPADPTSPPDISGFTPSQTSYLENDDDEMEWFPIWVSADDDDEVKLQLIIANTPHPKDPDDMDEEQEFDPVAINTKSVVMAIEWDGWWMVATGDATAATLGAVNDLLEDAEIPSVFMMTMPHHGSRKTTYNLSNANKLPKAPARQVVEDFLDIFDPSTVSISAGEKPHHHPSMLMTIQFAEHTDQDLIYWSDDELDDDRHFITCWIDLPITNDAVLPTWPAMWLYSATQTDNNVYSTLYFKDDPYNRKYVKAKTKGFTYKRFVCPPLWAEDIGGNAAQVGIPEGRNWFFSIEPGDDVRVGSDENEARALAGSAELLIAAKSPPASYVTNAGRLARVAPAPAAPTPMQAPMPAAGPAPRSIAEPAGPRLRSLKLIA